MSVNVDGYRYFYRHLDQRDLSIAYIYLSLLFVVLMQILDSLVNCIKGL